jgi:hypothetical protein
VVIGIFVANFPRAWPWSERRWDFVGARMAELASTRWHGDAEAIGAAFKAARSVRSIDEPHLAPWLPDWAACNAAPRPLSARRATLRFLSGLAETRLPRTAADRRHAGCVRNILERAMTAILRNPPFTARCLGFGGLIPFVVLAAAAWLAPAASRPLVVAALLGYGAAICSFLGAIHWGLSMRDGSAPRAPSLIWGVVPSLLGWLALLLDRQPGLLLVTATLCACFAVDRSAYPRALVQAWLPLRFRLTLVACLSCLVAAAAPVFS